MPVAITRYSVLLSSPSDTDKECQAAEQVIQTINRTHSETTGIELYPKDWKRDSRADSGDEPQALLNEQIVKDSDIILAIFKNRFGSPTSSYGSGTEEEIELGLELDKTVLVYFWVPSDESQIADMEEYSRITEFRNRIASKGIYKTFADIDELKQHVMHDFTSLIFELERGGTATKSPALILRQANRKYIHNERYPINPHEPFLSQLINYKGLDDRIRSNAELLVAKAHQRQEETRKQRELEEQMREMAERSKAADGSTGVSIQTNPAFAKAAEAIGKSITGNVNFAAIAKSADAIDLLKAEPVEFSDDEKAIVKSILNEIGIEYTDEVFDLGNLKRDTMMIPGKQPELRGTEEERERFALIQTLIQESKIRSYLKTFIERNIDIYALGLCIANDGGSPALNVKVELKLPTSYVAAADELSMPSDELAEYLLGNDRDLFGELFEIEGGPDVDSYHDANSSFVAPRMENPSFNTGLGWSRNYYDANDCKDDLDSLLGYITVTKSIDGEGYVAKLEYDRVQHGASYAFPCFLLFKGEMPEALDYRIRCDETPKPAEGSVSTKPSE